MEGFRETLGIGAANLFANAEIQSYIRRLSTLSEMVCTSRFSSVRDLSAYPIQRRGLDIP